jgi:hypothetical protein
VDDDVDAPERRDRLAEQPLDIELIGGVGADRDRRATPSEDLVDGGVGVALVMEIADDNGIAMVGEAPRDRATARPAPREPPTTITTRSSSAVSVGCAGTTCHCDVDRPRSHQGNPLVWSPWSFTLSGPMAVQRLPPFRGRSNEREVLDRLLDDVRKGRSAVLMLVGEAGIGKTALLRYAARQASGFRLLQIAAVESEMELAYAGLHQLCAPMLDHLDKLPEPQRDALSVAFGFTSGDSRDRFLIALAALSLLSTIAADRPLLCLVDDVQWLDDASAQALGFVARRLLADRVAIVFAARDPSDQRLLAGLRELRLEGLEDDDARALLASVIPGRIDEQVRDRIVSETRGNPLAIVELSRGTSAGELAGGFGLPNAGDLGSRIEDHYVGRARALPEATQRLMLLAAADPIGDASLLWRAAETLDIGLDAAIPATAERLLEIGARVRFQHPLVRSAVYRAAPVEDRRVAHGTLAAAIDAGSDPDRRAWHRAHAVIPPDDGVATELIECAAGAERRGASRPRRRSSSAP